MDQKKSSNASEVLKIAYLMHRLMNRGLDKKAKEYRRELEKQGIMSRRDFLFLSGIFKLTNGDSLIKMNEVAEAFQVTPAAVSQVARKFEKEGLIQRKIHDDDRRSAFICLTAKGKELLEKDREIQIRRVQGLLDYLGKEDSETMIRILEKVLLYYENQRSVEKKED